MQNQRVHLTILTFKSAFKIRAGDMQWLQDRMMVWILKVYINLEAQLMVVMVYVPYVHVEKLYSTVWPSEITIYVAPGHFS